jgi:hypothetical protein
VLTAFVPDFFPTQTEPFVPDKPVNLTVKIKRPNLTITGTVVTLKRESLFGAQRL